MEFSFQKKGDQAHLMIKDTDSFGVMSCVTALIKTVIESSKLPEDVVLYAAALGAACAGKDDVPENVDNKICDLLGNAKEVVISKKMQA